MFGSAGPDPVSPCAALTIKGGARSRLVSFVRCLLLWFRTFVDGAASNSNTVSHGAVDLTTVLIFEAKTCPCVSCGHACWSMWTRGDILVLPVGLFGLDLSSYSSPGCEGMDYSKDLSNGRF
ncbi:hypothetical protein chiPu_0015305 [Chiloscyllium punctatum]|uniref:Uncharacterized protein n=1 Tax=Chiloscyllium punctatum TaxID=137246 RepID=A0A401T2C0_CHIPU|nr:hypothetical protein [Chiloscyllium punctatum]